MSFLLTGCAYYNYFYNANKYFEEGEKAREKGEEEKSSRKGKNLSSYDRCIESAGRMIEYYPDSRWEDDALLLLAKAYYRVENYRKAIGKVDELTAKYPESELVLESLLWKGMSLLKVIQPDSGRLILSGLSGSDALPELKAQAHQALGDYYFDLEQWDSALEEFRQVLNSGIKDKWLRGIALIRIGECLNEADRIDEAAELYDEILSSKPSRRIKLEATLQRAIILRRIGRLEEAFESLEVLLSDAAYIKDFPRIELEVTRCLSEMGDFDEARKRLEKLLETNRRGEIAAEVSYDTGLLLWERYRDPGGALKALNEVKKADRSSPLSADADSLADEIEVLYRSWQRMGFLDGQISAIDSSLNGYREFFYTDTSYVDSLDLILEEERKGSGKKSRYSRERGKDKKSKEPEPEQAETDSTDAEIDSTVAPLDSTALTELLSSRKDELLQAQFELAGYHLFKRNDLDSSTCYFTSLAEDYETGETWGRIIASLAYIAKAQGDTAAHDSLYESILDRMEGGPFVEQAHRVLGHSVSEVEIDSLLVMFEDAEDMWLEKDDPQRAREMYLTIADNADSASENRARALFAAAYLSRKALHDDSLAAVLYINIAENFTQTPYGRLAKDRSRGKVRDEKPGGRLSEPAPESDDMLLESIPIETEREGDITDFPEKIYDPNDVDVLPEMLTSSSLLKNYLRSYAPVLPFGEEVSGRVELKFVVGKYGEVTDVIVLSVEPDGKGYEEAAQEVLAKIRYKAGRYHGRTVAVHMKQVFVFEKSDLE